MRRQSLGEDLDQGVGELEILLMAADVQGWEVDEETGIIGFAQLGETAVVDVIAEISAGVITELDILVLLPQFVGHQLEVQRGLEGLIKGKMRTDLLVLALEPIVIRDPEVFVVVAAFLQEVDFIGPYSKMEIENPLILIERTLAKFFQILIDCFDSDIKFAQSEFGMGFFCKLIDEELCGVDFDIPEGLKSCQVDSVKHDIITLAYLGRNGQLVLFMYNISGQKAQQGYIHQKYEEGLQTIRSRITALNHNNSTSSSFTPSHERPTGYLDTQSPTRKTAGVTMTGKLDQLSQQLAEISGEIGQISIKQKQLRNSFEWIKQDLHRQIDRDEKQNSNLIEGLRGTVRAGIEFDEERSRKIDGVCQMNLSNSHMLKASLIEISLKVESVENCLGGHTMRDKV